MPISYKKDKTKECKFQNGISWSKRCKEKEQNKKEKYMSTTLSIKITSTKSDSSVLYLLADSSTNASSYRFLFKALEHKWMKISFVLKSISATCD